MLWALLGRDGRDVVCAKQADLRDVGDLLLLLASVDALDDVLLAHAGLGRLLLELAEALRRLLDGGRHELLLCEAVEGVFGRLADLPGDLLDRSRGELASLLAGLGQHAGRGHLLVALRDGVDLLALAVVDYRLRQDVLAIVGGYVAFEGVPVFAAECLMNSLGAVCGPLGHVLGHACEVGRLLLVGDLFHGGSPFLTISPVFIRHANFARCHTGYEHRRNGACLRGFRFYI